MTNLFKGQNMRCRYCKGELVHHRSAAYKCDNCHRVFDMFEEEVFEDLKSQVEREKNVFDMGVIECSKTIKVKKEMSFRELMEHIIKNNVTGYFKNDDGYGFDVNTQSHCFLFDKNYVYGFTETYEVEVEREITTDMKFRDLIEITKTGRMLIHELTSIKKVMTEYSSRFYILLDGELVNIWECEEQIEEEEE